MPSQAEMLLEQSLAAERHCGESLRSIAFHIQGFFELHIAVYILQSSGVGSRASG